MKFGQILVCCMTNISNMFLVDCWRLETSCRHFYDFIKMTIQQDLAICNVWHIPSGNNLESKGSVWKNKKALCLVSDTKVPLFKDHFWHFQIKIKFQKKLWGRAAFDYQTLISSGLFPAIFNSPLFIFLKKWNTGILAYLVIE